MLSGYIDRIFSKSKVKTTQELPAGVPLQDAGKFIPAIGKDGMVTVTVARGRTIGRGKTAKTQGEELDVSLEEAMRLRAQGFIA